MVAALDEIDKVILLELGNYCRVSFQALANQLGLSVNAIKKRYTKLKGSGIIRSFNVYPSLAMVEAESLVGRVFTKTPPRSDVLLDTIGANPMVDSGSYLADGSLLVFADYVGSQGLAKFGSFLRSLEDVTHIELHPLICEKGSKRDLSQSELKVLRCLRNDARMPISEIAQQTKMSPKRIRNTIQQLFGETGSAQEIFIEKQSIGDYRTKQACMHSRILWDLNASDGTAFVIRLEWVEEATTLHDVVEWVRTQHPIAFWFAFASAIEPVIFSIFLVEHMRDAEPIANSIQKASFVNSVEAIFSYPTKRFPNLRDDYLNALFKKIDI
jgi:DNA-binding Lrp family transcriptional regulator